MAHIIFDNMMKALQDLSDGHAEETNLAFIGHNSWLTSTLAEAWQSLNGSPDENDSVVISAPSGDVCDAAVASHSPAKPPIAVVPARNANKLGIAASGKPPAFKKKSE